ncbi:MAG TPA: VTT domain-containing protein, partial [Gammaproteobacteria bacterium]
MIAGPVTAPRTFRSRLGLCLAGVGVLLLLAVLVLDWRVLLDSGQVAPARWSLAPEAFVELIRGWGAWGVAGSLGLMVLHSFVPFPAECLAIANGMVFGFLWGSVITWSGAMLGALLAFGLARSLGQPFVQRRLSARNWGRVEHWSHAHGWSTLLTARLVPV